MNKITSKSWKDGSMVKITGCSFTEHRFNSQQQYSGPQPSLTEVQRNTTHSSDLCRHWVWMRYMYSHVCKTPVHIKMCIILIITQYAHLKLDYCSQSEDFPPEVLEYYFLSPCILPLPGLISSISAHSSVPSRLFHPFLSLIFFL